MKENRLHNNFKNYNGELRIVLWGALSLIIILSLAPFFKIGFTTADDLQYYIRALKGGLLEDAYFYAMGQGRFYFLFTKPLYHLIYLIDNFYFVKVIQYGMLLLSFSLFTMVISKICKQNKFSILIFLLLFSFLSVSKPMYFMPIVAYPPTFTFSFSILLITLLLLLKYMETTQYKYLLFSAGVFVFALLFYETYLLSLFFICVFLFFRSISIRGNQTFTNKLFYKEIVPFISIGIIYLTVYFLYRESISDNVDVYSGTAFAANFNIHHFFKILWNYNLSAIPTFTYYDSQNIIAANSLLESGHQQNFWYILTHSKITSVINTLIQSFVFLFLCHKMENKISWKKILLLALAFILLTFSSHLLIAISEKYNSSVGWSSNKGYVTTFFSYFFITSLIALLIYTGIKACYKYKWLKNSFIIVATASLFVVSIIIGYSNDHLSRDLEHNRNSFKVMDLVLKKGALNDLPEDAIICSKELCASSSVTDYVIFWQSSVIWRDFVIVKTQKKMNIYDNIQTFQEKIAENPQSDIYYFTKVEASKSNDILIVLLKIVPDQLLLHSEIDFSKIATACEAKIYYYSKNKEFTFAFFIPECENGSSIFINNIEKEVVQGLTSFTINNSCRKEIITSFTIKSEHPFAANRFIVSNMVISENAVICVE